MVFAKERSIVAIDISDSFIKLAAISTDKGARALSVIDAAELPSNKDKDIAKEIRSLISKNRLGKSYIYVSFPRHLVTIRNVKLPTANEQEVKKMAALQAIKYLPYTQDEMVIDYKTIEITKDGYADILLILAQRKLINRYVDIFKYAGVSIEKIALSSEGLLNWYSTLQYDDKQPISVIDFDRYHTHIQIIKNKTLYFSRSVSFDTTDPDSNRTVLLREIRLSFDSFLKEKNESISRIILSGREDYAREFLSFIYDNLSIQCEQVRQLQSVTPKGISYKSFNAASFTYLLGIVLEPQRLAVNLLPREIISKRKEVIFKNELVKTAILILAVLVAAFSIAEKKMNNKRNYLRKIDVKLKEMEPEVKRLSKLKQNIELIQNQLMLEGSSIDILRELYAVLPKDVSLTLFEFEDKSRVLLRGTTRELSIVFNLLPILEKSPYFKNVKINFATKRTFRNKEFADFEILCALR
jgi:Tfp pilus assembly PilM family ATPase